MKEGREEGMERGRERERGRESEVGEGREGEQKFLPFRISSL